MHLGRLGSLLILASCGFFALTIGATLTGASVSVGGPGPGGLFLTVGLGLIAVGGAVLGIAGSPALRSKVARAGLIVAPVGLVATLATAQVSASSMLVVVFLIGGATFGIGSVVTILGLLGSPGSQRAAALTVLGGVLLGSVASLLPTFARSVPGQPVSPLGILAVVLGLAGGAIVLAGVIRIALLGMDLRPRFGGPEA
jgi:hypothetical protein